MPRKRFTEEQIALALRQHEGGAQVAEIIRKLGVTGQTFYRWKKKFAGSVLRNCDACGSWRKRTRCSSRWSPTNHVYRPAAVLPDGLTMSISSFEPRS